MESIRAPRYGPAQNRDRKAFALVDLAHRLGYRAMPHTNVLCLTFEHPTIAASGTMSWSTPRERTGWALDIDGDWLAGLIRIREPGVKA
jgi:hypothetical protein